jgi:hypothetical protein
MVEKSGAGPLSRLLLERALAFGARDNVTVMTVAIDGEPGRERASGAQYLSKKEHGDAGEDEGTARNESLSPS